MTKRYSQPLFFWCEAAHDLGNPASAHPDIIDYRKITSSMVEGLHGHKHEGDRSWIAHYTAQFSEYGRNTLTTDSREQISFYKLFEYEMKLMPFRHDMYEWVLNSYRHVVENSQGKETPYALACINAWWLIVQPFENNALLQKGKYPILSGIIRILDHALDDAFYRDRGYSQGESHFNFLCRELQPVLNYLNANSEHLRTTVELDNESKASLERILSGCPPIYTSVRPEPALMHDWAKKCPHLSRLLPNGIAALS